MDHNAEEEEEPLVCMICEDKATGLHYGIITCEGYVVSKLHYDTDCDPEKASESKGHGRPYKSRFQAKFGYCMIEHITTFAYTLT
jgi:hypothetical protein